GSARSQQKTVTIGAIVKQANTASPISGTENIARQLSSERLGGTRLGGNQPARGFTSDHSTPTTRGTVRPIRARPKNSAVSSHRNERVGKSQVRVTGPPRPAPPPAGSTGRGRSPPRSSGPTRAPTRAPSWRGPSSRPA